MFVVRLFSSQKTTFAEVSLAGNTNLFKYQPPFDLTPIQELPTLINRTSEIRSFSFDNCDDDLSKQVVSHYRKVATTYRTVWTKLDSTPPDGDEEVFNQFHTFIYSKNNTTSLDLCGCNLSLIGLEFLKDYKKLQELKLENCHLRDEHLEKLSIFPELKTLNLSHNPDVQTIPYHPIITTIDVSHTNVKISSKRYLEESSCLQELNLVHTPLGKAIQNGVVLDEELENELNFRQWQDFIKEKQVVLLKE